MEGCAIFGPFQRSFRSLTFPHCLSSQAKFSCFGNKSLAAHQAFHLNGRNLFHAMVLRYCPEVCYLVSVSRIHFLLQMQPFDWSQSSNQTYFLPTAFTGKPSEFGELWVFFFFVQKELYLWKSFVQEVQVSQKSVVSGHLLILTNNWLSIFYLIF